MNDPLRHPIPNSRSLMIAGGPQIETRSSLTLTVTEKALKMLSPSRMKTNQDQIHCLINEE